jgi:uncharacterized protein (TIGR01732 family)
MQTRLGLKKNRRKRIFEYSLQMCPNRMGKYTYSIRESSLRRCEIMGYYGGNPYGVGGAGYPGYGYGCGGNVGGTFVLIVVLFILLIIVGASKFF